MSDSITDPAVIGVPLLYKVADAVVALRMSRAYVYKQIKAGRLRTVHEGGATFITASALADYIALLEREAAESDAGNAASASQMAAHRSTKVATENGMAG